MILSLYVILVGIAVILILIGLLKPEESAQSLVGFLFLFLLSIILLNGNLEYETGINTSLNLNYDVNGTLTSTDQIVSYTYEDFSDTTSHRIGYYLAIASAVGFCGTLFSIGKAKWGNKE